MGETRTVSSGEARVLFRDLLNEVEHDDTHIVVTRYGKPAGVIVSQEWYDDARAALAIEAAR